MLLTAGALGFVLTARHEQPDLQRMVRAYFATRGGAAPLDKARLIDVSGCVPLDVEAGGHTIYRCSLGFENQGFVACFTFDHGRVAAGSVELGDQKGDVSLGCDYVGWDAQKGSLVVL